MALVKRLLPDEDRLREVLEYDAVSGDLFWKPREIRPALARIDKGWNTKYAGSKAGIQNGHGYIRVDLDGGRFMAHRLIWKWFYGTEPGEIDHINGKRSDNRIGNLRIATRSQNIANSRARSDNRSGLKGVHKRKHTWRAIITRNGRSESLGEFGTAEEAHDAYRREAAKTHGEYHRA